MSEEYSDEKIESILGKIRALTANADNPATPPEAAENYRAKAEALMFKYRVDEATAVASGSADGLVPVFREYNLGSYTSEFRERYQMIAGTVRTHTGVRAHVRYENGDISMKAVGYESDLRYMEMLLTAALLEFGKRLEPKYDPGLSDEENAWRMRSAGMERKRIARVIFGDWTSENEMKAKNRKVTRLIRLYAAENGEDADALLGRGNNMETYRDSYADGFVVQFQRRLLRMRWAQGEDSGALVLADRQERVDEAYYDRFPQFRPQPASTPRIGESQAECVKCKKAKSGYCRDHAWMRPSRAVGRGSAFNDTAYRAGESAANMIDLGSQSTGTRRTTASDRKEIGR